METSVEIRLSVAIITFNEEQRLPDCLDSVADWADEIVVLDSFSTDATQEICRRYGKLKFHQHEFDGHIEQKNRAIELCRGQWVLCIDADERVSHKLAVSIQEFLYDTQYFNGAEFPRLTYHMKKEIRYGGWYPNRRPRLIRKGKASWGGENPHDVLIVQGRVKRLRGDLIHLSFDDLAHQVKTINYFSSIVALTRYNKGKRFFLWRLLLKPISKFLEIYLIKLGLLDGMQGFIIAVSSAYSTFLKEAKLFELVELESNVPSNLNESRYQKKSP